MKNVVKLSYLGRDFIRFENENNEIRYLIYIRAGSICSPGIKTMKMVIEQLLEESGKLRMAA